MISRGVEISIAGGVVAMVRRRTNPSVLVLYIFNKN